MNDEKQIRRLNHLGSHHGITVGWSSRLALQGAGYIEISHKGKSYLVARYQNWAERVQTWITHLAARKEG